MTTAPMAPTRTKEFDIVQPTDNQYERDPYSLEPNYEVLITGFVKEYVKTHAIRMKFDFAISIIILRFYPIYRLRFGLCYDEKFELFNDNTVCKSRAYLTIRQHSTWQHLVFARNNNDGYNEGINYWSLKNHQNAISVGVIAVNDECKLYDIIKVELINDNILFSRNPNASWRRHIISYSKYNRRWSYDDIITVVLDCTIWSVKYYLQSYKNNTIKLIQKDKIKPSQAYYFVTECTTRMVSGNTCIEYVEVPLIFMESNNKFEKHKRYKQFDRRS
eukprot:297624_1